MAKRLERVEDAEVIEVGKYYLVPTFNTLPYGYIPVTGPLHEDKEYIKFEYQHYHIDWRFARAGMGYWGDDVEFAKVFMPINMKGESAVKPGGELHYRRWKCVRVVPDYPGMERPVRWLPDLETAYAGRKLGNGLICPHRGVCIKNAVDPSAPLLPNDLATCPAHGLQWNIKTGEMVRRTPCQ